MNSENIIAVNVPNVITIIVIALLGGVVIGIGKKWYAARMGG